MRALQLWDDLQLQGSTATCPYRYAYHIIHAHKYIHIFIYLMCYLQTLPSISNESSHHHLLQAHNLKYVLNVLA
jgi:hypothetical protein